MGRSNSGMGRSDFDYGATFGGGEVKMGRNDRNSLWVVKLGF